MGNLRLWPKNWVSLVCSGKGEQVRCRLNDSKWWRCHRSRLTLAPTGPLGSSPVESAVTGLPWGSFSAELPPARLEKIWKWGTDFVRLPAFPPTSPPPPPIFWWKISDRIIINQEKKKRVPSFKAWGCWPESYFVEMHVGTASHPGLDVVT